MRTAIPTVLAGFLLVTLLPGADPLVQPTKEQIEADLKLVAIPPKDRVIEAGTQPFVEFKLVNSSKMRTHRVVKPGDGSEVGWRDPWVHVTAEQRGVDGKWAAMERLAYGRCGLFDHDWPKDVVELKPGEELKLSDWYSPGLFEFQYPGQVRLVGHYEYRAVGGKDGKPRPDAERGQMAGVPLFTVHSEPVEFTVVRPLDVRVKVKKSLKVGRESKASDVLEVTVTNNSDRPRTVGNVSQNDYRLTITPLMEFATRPELKDAPVYSATRELKPGETITIFGSGDFANNADGTWKGLKAGTTRVRVYYSVSTNNSAMRIIHGDAEIKVEE